MAKGWIGPLVQAKDGKKPWVCDYTHPLTGKKKRQKIAEAGANKKQREKAYRDFENKLEKGERVGKSNQIFGDALDAYEKWCEQRLAVRDRMEEGTLARLRHTMNAHLRPDLGHIPIEGMTTPRIETYLFEKAKKFKTMHFECYQVIKSALDRAVKIDMISISPLDVKKIWLPPRQPSTRTIPTIEEGRALWNALLHEENPKSRPHSFETRIATVSLAMFGGMCAGEMSGLQWENVDFIDAVIFVEHSLSRYGGLKGPKTKDRQRYIPLSSEMNEWLTKIARRQGYPRTGYVFKPDPLLRQGNGQWRDPEGNHLLRSMTSQLQEAQVRLGFKDDDGKARWTMHELRHYAGSVWLKLGYRLEDVSRMLGHGKIETTKKYYIHYFKKQNLERDRELMTKVSELHRLPSSGALGLPKPVRDSCEIEGEAVELKE